MGGSVSDDIDWPALVKVGTAKLLLHRHCTPEYVALNCTGRLVYLATPYSREVTRRGQWDYRRSVVMQGKAAKAALDLCLAGVTAISPIVLSAEMCHVAWIHTFDADPMVPDPLDAGLWEAWCRPLLCAAGAVVVPDIIGWNRSAGVWREAAWAVEHGVPVYLYGDAA